MLVNRNVPRVACSVLVLGLGLALAGCQSIGKALGVTKASPNEFLVYTHKPLIMPSGLRLPPPQYGALPRNDLTPAGQAEAALFPRRYLAGTQLTSAGAYSDGEIALLENASAVSAGSQIRQVVNAESRLPGLRRAQTTIAALPAAPRQRIARVRVRPPSTSAVARIPALAPPSIPEALALDALVPVQVAANEARGAAPLPARSEQRIASVLPQQSAGLVLLRRTLER
jgi:hypothetical protein